MSTDYNGSGRHGLTEPAYRVTTTLQTDESATWRSLHYRVYWALNVILLSFVTVYVTYVRASDLWLIARCDLFLIQLHSAYIEVAELLVDKDPLGAVDVYSRLPTASVPTFDDAYIFGEIVRILFKLEAYDDPRLLSNMIAMGTVMGFGMSTCILCYLSICNVYKNSAFPIIVG